VGFMAFSSLSIICASALYFVRTHFAFDEILSWIFTSPETKFKIIWLVWNPPFLILGILSSLILAAVAQSLFLKIIIFFQKRDLSWLHLLIFTFWVPANALFSIPLAVIFFRMLHKPGFVLISAVILGILAFWLAVRMLRGTIIILQLARLQSLLISLVIFLAFAGLLFTLFERSHAVIAFSRYWSSFILR